MNSHAENVEPIVKRMKSGNEGGVNELQKEESNCRAVSSESHGNAELENEEEVVSVGQNDEEDDDSFRFPPDEDITDMLSEVEYTGSFPTITDRYFTSYYKLNVQCPGDDIRIMMHSNRICMLSLAQSHAALQSGKCIKKVDFKVSEKLDRSLNKVSGKSKHGAQPLQGNSNICMISCSDGETYTIKCCMIGKLVEVNEALLENPKLLLEPPHRGGYLAIILPNIKLLEKMKEALLTEEQYRSAILDRQNARCSEASKLNNCDNHNERSNGVNIVTESGAEIIDIDVPSENNSHKITVSMDS